MGLFNQKLYENCAHKTFEKFAKQTRKYIICFVYQTRVLQVLGFFFPFHKKHIKREAHCHRAVATFALIGLSIFSKNCFFEGSYSKLFREFTIEWFPQELHLSFAD